VSLLLSLSRLRFDGGFDEWVVADGGEKEKKWN
jgi:hypothetical protein